MNPIVLVLIGCAVMAAAAAILWLSVELHREKTARMGAEKAARDADNRLGSALSRVECYSKEILKAVKEVGTMLDALADGVPADPDAKKTLAANLEKLMAYSMEDAMAAARGDRSDG